MFFAFAASLALAAVPSQIEVRPSPEPGDIYTLYAEFARSKGRSGAATVPACVQGAEKLALCFSTVTEGVRRLITEQDLYDWNTTPEDLSRRASAASEGAFEPGRFEVRQVEGMKGRYWVSASGDGLDAAGLLHPERLEAIAGARPVVAVPDRDTVLFWVPGDAEFDKVLAVGVRRMSESSDHPVSTLIYQWDGEKWATWGEARAAPVAPPAAE